jgi:hypothetical protein
MCVKRCGTVSLPLPGPGEKRHSDELTMRKRLSARGTRKSLPELKCVACGKSLEHSLPGSARCEQRTPSRRATWASTSALTGPRFGQLPRLHRTTSMSQFWRRKSRPGKAIHSLCKPHPGTRHDRTKRHSDVMCPSGREGMGPRLRSGHASVLAVAGAQFLHYCRYPLTAAALNIPSQESHRAPHRSVDAVKRQV